MKTLHLTLNKPPFDTMETGLKDSEYRKPSKWIKSRLIDSKTGKDKDIDFVRLTNGYGADKPYYICRYLGYEIAKRTYAVNYSNGFSIRVFKGQYRILLGKPLKIGNIDSKELF